MSGRYVVEEAAECFVITDVQEGLGVVRVNKTHHLGESLSAEVLAGRVRNLVDTLHAEQEQLVQDRQTLDTHLLSLNPYELKTLADGVRAGGKLLTPDQL